MLVKHVELGQGTYTGLPTLVAEELDAAWSQIKVVGAPADAQRCRNTIWRAYFGLDAQGTGGSTAMANSFEQYRQAGAAARAMLVAAAAERWKVPSDAIQVKNGVVSHASGKKATFGELADAASKQAGAAESEAQGCQGLRLHRKARAANRRQGEVERYRAVSRRTSSCPGCSPRLLRIRPGSAPRSRASTPPASSHSGRPLRHRSPQRRRGIGDRLLGGEEGPRRAQDRVGREPLRSRSSSPDILAEYKRLAETPGAIARNDGDAAKAIAGAAKSLEGAFEFPYLAHATMEPMNCVVKLDADRCEVWNGEQFQTRRSTRRGEDRGSQARAGIHQPAVRGRELLAAGRARRRITSSRRRRSPMGWPPPAERNMPVKLVWTREDDMKAGYFRPRTTTR